jgi:hypothetical protein
LTLLPGTETVDWAGSHRLIPSRFSDSGTVLSELAESPEELEALILLDGATNERVQGEQGGLAGISTYELVYGIPNARIVNAAFTHTNEYGSRFSDSTRGAWYAADRLEGSLAEVTYHKGKRLSDMIVPGEPHGKPAKEVSTFDDWRADFRSIFHVLAPAEQFSEYLKPEPVPACYAASQGLARQLLHAGSNGLRYPSVRHQTAQCLVCFRPALVYNPRRGERLEIVFTATATGYEYSWARVEAALNAR